MGMSIIVVLVVSPECAAVEVGLVIDVVRADGVMLADSVVQTHNVVVLEAEGVDGCSREIEGAGRHVRRGRVTEQCLCRLAQARGRNLVVGERLACEWVFDIQPRDITCSDGRGRYEGELRISAVQTVAGFPIEEEERL